MGRQALERGGIHAAPEAGLALLGPRTGRSGELELLVGEEELLWGKYLSGGVCTCNRNREEML